MTLRLVYKDPAVSLYQGDCRDVMALLADRSVSMCLTDPPYDQQTHAGARTGSGDRQLVTFDHATSDELRDTFGQIGRVCSRWVVSFMDWKHAAAFESQPPLGLRFVRAGAWVKPGSAPQFTGDRPGTGWEALAIMHRSGGKMRWNGGGRHAVWTHAIERGAHPTQKPVALCGQLIRQFSDPGDIVIDPFCGSGSVLRAAKDNGRRAIGVERDPAWCEYAAKRLRQECLLFDAVDRRTA